MSGRIAASPRLSARDRFPLPLPLRNCCNSRIRHHGNARWHACGRSLLAHRLPDPCHVDCFGDQGDSKEFLTLNAFQNFGAQNSFAKHEHFCVCPNAMAYDFMLDLSESALNSALLGTFCVTERRDSQNGQSKLNYCQERNQQKRKRIYMISFSLVIATF